MKFVTTLLPHSFHYDKREDDTTTDFDEEVESGSNSSEDEDTTGFQSEKGSESTSRLVESI